MQNQLVDPEIRDPHIARVNEQFRALISNKQYREAFHLLSKELQNPDLTELARQWLLHYLGEILYLEADYQRSERFILMSKAINEQIGHNLGIGRNHYILGNIWDIFFGDFTEAIKHYKMAKEYFEKSGNRDYIRIVEGPIARLTNLLEKVNGSDTNLRANEGTTIN